MFPYVADNDTKTNRLPITAIAPPSDATRQSQGSLVPDCPPIQSAARAPTARSSSCRRSAPFHPQSGASPDTPRCRGAPRPLAPPRGVSNGGFHRGRDGDDGTTSPSVGRGATPRPIALLIRLHSLLLIQPVRGALADGAGFVGILWRLALAWGVLMRDLTAIGAVLVRRLVGLAVGGHQTTPPVSSASFVPGLKVSLFGAMRSSGPGNGGSSSALPCWFCSNPLRLLISPGGLPTFRSAGPDNGSSHLALPVTPDSLVLSGYSVPSLITRSLHLLRVPPASRSVPAPPTSRVAHRAASVLSSSPWAWTASPSLFPHVLSWPHPPSTRP